MGVNDERRKRERNAGKCEQNQDRMNCKKEKREKME